MSTPRDHFRMRRAAILRSPAPGFPGGMWSPGADSTAEDAGQLQFQRLFGQLPQWLQEHLAAPDQFWIGEVPGTSDRSGRLAWSERAAHGGSVVFMTSGLFL